MITKRAFFGTFMALILGGATSLAQAGVFEYNPLNVGGTDATYSGDELVGTFSSGFTSTDGFASFNATGWLRFDTVNLDSDPQVTGGLNADYQLWAEFSYTAVGGAGGGTVAPFYTIADASFQLYAGEGIDRDFTPATGGTGTPTVTTNAGVVTLLGGGGDTVLFGAIFNTPNASLFNLDSNFLLDDLGFFFTAPDPFFNVAFQTSSSVLPVISGNTGTLNGTAEVRFDTVPVPEPASIALLGLGLLALGWAATARRRRAG